MEHDRWREERETAGWVFDEASDRDGKRSRYLVDWDDLPEDGREYCRVAVRCYPLILSELGIELYESDQERPAHIQAGADS